MSNINIIIENKTAHYLAGKMYRKDITEQLFTSHLQPSIYPFTPPPLSVEIFWKFCGKKGKKRAKMRKRIKSIKVWIWPGPQSPHPVRKKSTLLDFLKASLSHLN